MDGWLFMIQGWRKGASIVLMLLGRKKIIKHSLYLVGGPVFLRTSFKIFKKQYNYFWSGGGGGGPAGGADSARHQAAGQGQGQQGQEDQPGCGEVQEDSRRGDISDHFLNTGIQWYRYLGTICVTIFHLCLLSHFCFVVVQFRGAGAASADIILFSRSHN